MVLLRPVTTEIMRILPGTKLVLGAPKIVKDQYLKNYAHRHFEVVEVPDNLVIPNSRRLLNNQGASITWVTGCEIKKGDIVWVQLRAGQSSFKVTMEGKLCYLVNYANLFVAQRRRINHEWGKKVNNVLKKDETLWDVIPLNGYIICETLGKQYNTKLLIPEKSRREKDTRIRIMYAGKPVSHYIGLNEIGHFYKKKADNTDLKTGDILYPRQSGMPGAQFWINIEGEYFHDFNGVNQLVAIERRFIMAYERN